MINSTMIAKFRICFLLLFCSLTLSAVAGSSPSREPEQTGSADVAPQKVKATASGEAMDHLVENSTRYHEDVEPLQPVHLRQPGDPSTPMAKNDCPSSPSGSGFHSLQANAKSSLSKYESKSTEGHKVKQRKVKHSGLRKFLKQGRSESGGKTRTLAILSVVFGAVGFLLYWGGLLTGFLFGITIIGSILLAMLAVILGSVSLAKKRPGMALSIVGVVIGSISILIPLMLVIVLLIFAG
jgi:hypothetical protein